MIIEIEKTGRHDELADYNAAIFKVQTDKKLVLESAYGLSVFLGSIIAGGALKIILNLQNVTAIDSAGIGILINSAKLIRKNSGDIVVCNVTSDIYKILQIVSLEKFIKIFISEAEAVHCMKKS